MTEEKRFPELGERVRLTEAYLRLSPRARRREGVIIGKGYGGTCWWIHWDGGARSAISKDWVTILPPPHSAMGDS